MAAWSGARRREAVQRNGLAALLLSPAVLLFTVFVVLPMVEAAWYSFYRWNGYGTPTQYVGLRNYGVLLRNGVFSSALLNTAMVVAVSLLVQLPLALGMALLTAKRFMGVNLFRTIFFLPYILGEVVAALERKIGGFYTGAKTQTNYILIAWRYGPLSWCLSPSATCG
jgi:raffinose/stachyose/melibiose transport system permease protein